MSAIGDRVSDLSEDIEISRELCIGSKKVVMKVVCLEGGHSMILNSTPHRHPLEVGVGKIKNLNRNPHFYCRFGFSRKKYSNLTYDFAFWFTDGVVIDKN